MNRICVCYALMFRLADLEVVRVACYALGAGTLSCEPHLYLVVLLSVLMSTFFTRCGHYVAARPVQSSSGPSIILQRGYKCLYSDPNRDAAILAVASFLEVDAACLVRLAARPDMYLHYNEALVVGTIEHTRKKRRLS